MPELNTVALSKFPPGLLSAADRHVWLDPGAADDTADGLTQLTPKKTWAAAAGLVGMLTTSTTTTWLHLMSGGVTPSTPVYLPGNGGRVVIIGDGDGASIGDISANQTVVTTGTVTAADNVQGRMTMAGGMTEDEHLGLTWQVTSGAASGYRRTIGYNTTNTFHFGIGMQSAPLQVSVSDTYQVCHSDAYLDFPADDVAMPFVVQGAPPPATLTGAAQSAVTLINIGIRGTASTGTFARPQLVGGAVQMYGVHVDRSAAWCKLELIGCHLGAGLDDDGTTLANVPEALGAAYAPDAYAWRGWGIGKSATGAGTYGSWIYGDRVSTMTAYGVGDYVQVGHLRWMGGTLWEQQGYGGVYVPPGYRAEFSGYGSRSKLMRIKATSGDALSILGEVYNLDRPMLEAVSGDAIGVQRGGSLDYYNGPDDLASPIASALGLRVDAGGSARLTQYWNAGLIGGTTDWEVDGRSYDPSTMVAGDVREGVARLEVY